MLRRGRIMFQCFATNPGVMGEALRIVYRAISGFVIRKAGLTRGQAQCGAVTLIQPLHHNARSD